MPKKPVRILGSYVSYDVKQNEKLNFETKLQKMQGIFDVWNCRNLKWYYDQKIIPFFSSDFESVFA